MNEWLLINEGNNDDQLLQSEGESTFSIEVDGNKVIITIKEACLLKGLTSSSTITLANEKQIIKRVQQ